MAESGLYPELQKLASLVDEHPEYFVSGCETIQKAALDATKFVFDLSVQSEGASISHINELLSSLHHSLAPVTRSQSRANEKKDPAAVPPALFAPTPLASLVVEGMDEDQIWAQLDLRVQNVADALDFVLENEEPDDEEGQDGSEEDEGEDDDGDLDDERLRAFLKVLENGEDVDFGALGYDMDVDDILDDDGSDPNEEGSQDEGSQDEGHDSGEGTGSELEGEEGDEDVTPLRDPEADSDDDDRPGSTPAISGKRIIMKRRGKGHPELDDGFFDLSAFNSETERAEARSSSKGRLGGDEDSDSDDVSVDLFAPVDRDDFEIEEEDEHNESVILYKDFFDPPSRPVGARTQSKEPTGSPVRTGGRVRFNDEVRVRVLDKRKKDASDAFRQAGAKKRKLETPDLDSLMAGDDEEEGEDEDSEDGMEYPNGSEEEDLLDDEEEEDVDEPRRATIERSKDDLFAEEDTAPAQGISTHQKRMTELQAQISELESENIGPKDWVLMGEADSRKRPQNSLLEEYLEFDRAMKVVPVVTEEAVHNLEERIKARILERRFDDVIRVRAVEDKPFLPSRYFELKDTKSTQSLAQIYEDEFVAAQTGGVAGEDRDGKLKKEHDEIQQLWEKISHKLDALCNTHFTPKQPKAIISTISNVSTATLENALPTTQSTSTLLAPEEVFAPFAAEPQARSEMTPAQKKALHNKQRKARKKSRDELEKKVDKYAKVRGISGVKKQKQAALESVIKSGKGVTVVGKSKEALKKDRKRGSTVAGRAS